MKLAGWGRFPVVEAPLLGLRDLAAAQAALAGRPSLIARGNGRAYGDAALNTRVMLSTLPADRIRAYDPATGTITVEAGLLLADLLAFAVPRGWFVPVTPGTKFVTIGGMIAADVHGKNHHGAGTFGDHVESLTLLLADGSTRRCARDENAALFAATRGGMGLTGVILDASFRLIPIETAAIRQETRRAADLAEACAMLEAARDWTYTVAWIDCQTPAGRSLVYCGEHARREELPTGIPLGTLAVPRRKPKRIPLDFPSIALNRFSLRAFNELYWRMGKPGEVFVDYDSYFYPLDAVLEWNRIYGARGFTQFQCVIPRAAGLAGMAALLARIVTSGRGSFLAVLKLFGAENDGLLSFPAEGYTLALDFPVDAGTFNLLLELDAITADHGGRLYLAKDARMGAAMLRQGYPRLPEFRAVRDAVDPGRKFASLLSERLDL